MGPVPSVPTPPPDTCPYSRPPSEQAAADAIPVLVDNTYHLFHLVTPPATKHHPERLRSSWSRIRSSNLIEWTRDPEPALTPGRQPTDPDADGAWTGSAVLGLDKVLHLFYTGYNLSQGGRQVVLHTKARDRHGTRFEAPGTPIAIRGSLDQYEDIDFRDPFIFYNKCEARYWMLVATRLASGPHWSRGCIALLTSSDMETWTVSPEPLYAPNDMLCPECPELFTLPNGKWYLVYSRFHAPDAGTVYRIADHPRGPFRVPRDGSHGRLDGRRWYAAKSCPKAGDARKRIIFGWLGDYADDDGKWLWGGDLGIPREMSADGNGYLRIEVDGELRDFLWRSSKPVCPSNAAPSLYLCSVGSTATHFPELGPVALCRDLFVDFRVAACDAHSFGVMFQTDASGKGHRLQFSPAGHGLFSVSLWTDFPPLDDFWADQYRLYLPRPVDGPELVRHDNVSLVDGVFLVLRGQIVEAFCGGRSLSFRLPMPPPPSLDNNVSDGEMRRIGWFVEDGIVDLVHISIRYRIKNAAFNVVEVPVGCHDK
ncbi:glycosyl hydrolase [Thelonectria olida]|uniref:beta-fructofuranosidase n=1 Tax=Thelonectria olida TaxID=1576542 RepID=A0A9P9APG9_9HYPO|nr:glycosyl hydrolase [Thelonectria olida]